MKMRSQSSQAGHESSLGSNSYEDQLNIKQWLKKFPIAIEDEWQEKFAEDAEQAHKMNPVSL